MNTHEIDDRRARVREQTRLRLQRFRHRACNVDILTGDTDSEFLGLIRESPDMTKAIKNFREHLMCISMVSCTICNEVFPGNGDCVGCKKNPRKYTSENFMDPGIVPEQLAGLTMIEQLLIARASPVIKLWRVLGGQLKYKGHVITFPQDIVEIAYVLPRLPDEVSVVTIRRSYNDTHADFRVRRNKVAMGLKWLQQHNPFYNDITISQDRLELLPDDGNIVSHFRVVEDAARSDDTPNEMETEDSLVSEMNDMNFEEFETDIESGFMQGLTVNQRETITATLKNFAENQTLSWPQVSTQPVNEQNCPGYLTKCFPALFPFGNCDLSHQRIIKVSNSDFFVHLMKYNDGRFAAHSTFRFFALNWLLRQDILAKGSLFYVHNKDVIPPTCSDLREKFAVDQCEQLAKNIVYFGSKLYGSPGFWTEKRKEVHAMAEQLPSVTYFLTLSAADLHWPELTRLLQPDGVSRNGFNNVTKYPLLTTWLFQERVNHFFAHVLPQILAVEDYWLRYEWQSRGTPHVHALLWCRDSPPIQNLDSADEELKKTICSYFSEFVTTWIHGDTNATRERIQNSNPCARNPVDIVHPWNDYLDLCLFTQPHMQCSSYCLRRCKNTKKMKCKFGFPFRSQITTTLKIEDGKWKLQTERNDPYVNNHNVDILRVWRANMDLKPVVDQHSVLQYIMKYCTKAEKLSKSSSEIFQSLIGDMDEDTTSRSLIQRLLFKLLGQRDYSAQEVCHLLLKYPLTKCSRTFVHLKLNTETRYTHLGRAYSGGVGMAYLKQYRERDISDSQMFEISFFRYVQKYSRKYNNKVQERKGKTPVIVVYPYVPKTPLSEQYCEQYLTLHKAHINANEIKDPGQTWISAYEIFYPSVHGPELQDTNISDSSTDNESEDESNQCQWMAAQGVLPNDAIMNQVMVGSRPFDLLYDWSMASDKYADVLHCANFIKENATESAVEQNSTWQACNWSEDQQAILNLVSNHCYNEIADPLRIIVQGPAGSGKSQLINGISRITYSRNLVHVTMVTATTGVASSAIGAQTIHSAIMYRVQNGELQVLKGNAEKRLQESFRQVRYLVVDEFSMIGMEFLSVLDSRLRQARPDFANYPFGNLSVILVGDLGQLPVVRGTPLYVAQDKLKEKDYAGYALMQEFKDKYCLTTIHRQQGIEPEQVAFRDALARLRNGESTEADWKLFCTRHRGSLTVQEYERFDDAPRAFSMNEPAKKYNQDKLRVEGKPVAKIRSIDSGDVSGYTGRLERTLLLSQGSLVMLTQNYWVQAGLVNGALGTVTDIVFAPDSGPPELPLFALVNFPSYRGPQISQSCTSIPVAPETHCFVGRSGRACSRRQLPLMLAFAMTIHKTQSMTLPKLVVDFGPKEFAAGITYVGISRVKALSDIVIEGTFDFQRIAKIKDMFMIKQRRRYEQKHRHLM